MKAILCASCSVTAILAAPAALAQTADSAAPAATTQANATAPADGSADEVVVRGIRASLQRAADIKRTSTNVVDSIVADDIGKFPDRTVAAALQRVPGVQVTVGDNNEIVGPIIRGLADIESTLNGREIFTGAGRGFAFQDLPAEALARVDVYKTSSANLLEGGVAGIIDLHIHKPFDFKKGLTVAGTLRGTYALNTEHAGKTINPTFGLLVSSFRPEDEVKSNGWWNSFTDPSLTLENYKSVLSGGSSGESLTANLVNSIVISVPSVLIPISIAVMAAYAFAWMKFPGRDFLFVAIFALQIVPIQVTLIPLLKLYVQPPFNLMPLAGQDAPGGGFYTLWLSHTIFALPLAIYLLHNFMSQIPGELIESARVDGAGHVQIFTRIMLPLMAPAIAAFSILQFLWVWNDLLVAITFGSPNTFPLTARLAELSGTRGNDWFLLSAGAFVALVVPLIVFLSLQRYFVRGLLAGSVKG